jgi:hypothetical protein
MEVSGQLHAHCYKAQGSNFQYPLYRLLTGPQSQLEHCVSEKNLLPLLGIEPRFLSHPIYSLVTILTEPSHVHHIALSHSISDSYTHKFKTHSSWFLDPSLSYMFIYYLFYVPPGASTQMYKYKWHRDL